MNTELVKITEFLNSKQGMSSMVLNELLVRDNYTKKEYLKPCFIFKEFEENIEKLKQKGSIKIDVKYEVYNLNKTWVMALAIRLDEKEDNTYMTFYDLNNIDNVKLFEKLENQKEVGIIFYNERLEISYNLNLKNSPFKSNIGAIVNALKDVEFDEERGKEFAEIKREILSRCDNSAIIFYNGIN